MHSARGHEQRIKRCTTRRPRRRVITVQHSDDHVVMRSECYVVVSGTGFLQKLDQKMINMAKMAPLAAVAPGSGTCLGTCLGKKRSWRSDL